MSRVEVMVSFDLPAGVTAAEAEAYVREAVTSWKGSLAPDYPLFDLDGLSVDVRATRPGSGGVVLNFPGK